MITRYLIAAGLGVVASATVSTQAFAHIDPDPTEAQAGSEQSVGFTVQHGCDGSPTVRLDMRLPEGATNATPEAPAGWSATVDGNVITFQGGPLPDDQEMTFRVRLTLPPTADTTIYFPFVQRCEQGEIRWIDIPTDRSGTELDEPAPAMNLFGPVATVAPTTPAPSTTSPPTTASPTNAPTTTPATTTTVAVSTSVVASSPAPAITAPASSVIVDDGDGDGGSGGSNAGTFVFVGVLAAIAVTAGFVIRRVRR
jgi:uncharacterized protein YcnI